MRFSAWVSFLAPLLLLAACGGGDESSNEITVVPNLGDRREGLSEDETLDLFVSIMERRAEFMDGSADVSINENDTLSVRYSGFSEEIADQLYSRQGNLAIRGPRKVGDDAIACTTLAGEEVSVEYDAIVYQENEGRLIPACQLDDGTAVSIAWEDLETLELGVISNLDIATVALQTEPGPTVIVGFNEDGSLKLTSVSARLIGLPLGIFIDGQLVAGPRVGELIQNGQLAIAGLDLRSARILRAQLRAGAIPAPYIVRVND